MKKKPILLLPVLLMATVLPAQKTETNAGEAKTTPHSQAGLPPGFDIHALDRRVDPCTDFYQFSCGQWLANNPIPSDQPAWGRFNELEERNRDILHDILEKAAVNNSQRDAVEQKIGDYYASCMDEAAINAKGLGPLQAEFERVAALESKDALAPEIAHLHQIGVGALFDFSSDQDFKDATQEIAVADQGGLGLPDRDYYFKDDPKSVEIRKQYREHVQRMFGLMGEPATQAAADAQTVMQVETMLARVSMDRVTRRDPANIYHKLTTGQLVSLSPAFAWNRYFTGVDLPHVESLNVASPDFFTGMNEAIRSVSLENWKTYLRWHLLHSNAKLLPTKFVDANFDFYARTLTGQKEQMPRWKRCVRYTDGDLGEALGQPYVERTFGEGGKARTLKMVLALENALNQDINTVPWMTAATKKEAVIKLNKIANKIGYPDKWRDYSKLQIVRGDALGNSERANQFEFNRDLSKIGKPVDRKEWGMTPPTVNAYYNPQMNDINFPAGILQPPFFDNSLDDAVNFGAIGAVIGHELTHGFDDQGRQFDPDGNLRDWWTPEDAKAFESRTSCLVKQYDSYEVLPGVHLNGKLTLGENVADNGGLRLALMALHDTLEGKSVPPIDGFTPDQRLFLGWGQIWCESTSEPYQRMLAAINEHSDPKDRVNGVVSNMPEFQKAFHCKPGSAMVRENACRVW